MPSMRINGLVAQFFDGHIRSNPHCVMHILLSSISLFEAQTQCFQGLVLFPGGRGVVEVCFFHAACFDEWFICPEAHCSGEF